MNTALSLNVTTDELYTSSIDIEEEFRISARTAIARRSPAAPLKQIIKDYPHLIKGAAINYAKGRTSLDSEAIAEIAGMCNDYDFTHCPEISVLNAHYRFVYCGYCVNVLIPEARQVVWKTLAKLCHDTEGVVFVAARSDSDRGIKGTPFADGVKTSIGTFQIGYRKGQLAQEAQQHFEHVTEISGKGAYRIVACSHAPINLK
ncbi:hypothetical protein [Vibrio agarivorans]|uniref:hypothetical protein n=1 Tax=Vibrio agarivorans TaxID=153622 RepID=UPI0025B31743|nr:hypothetical protein [Vibrio agarivorans]MDN3661123.1 hypothetical protein [Vibrio agarivorans]